MVKKVKDIELLRKLVEIPSPSGFESKLSTFIKNYLSLYISKDNIKIDFHNNVIATIPGKSEKTIMIDAHLDQLGFLVSNINKDGLVSVISVGGHDISLIKGRNVSILTKNFRVINGVIGSKPIHLIWDEDKETPGRDCDVYIDIGTRNEKEVNKLIQIGDPVVLTPYFSNLLDNYYTGAGFDDKAGCFVLIETIKKIAKSKIIPEYTLQFTFSSQEELGCKGATELANRYNPELFIGLDVTFATDEDRTKDEEVGKCELGKGLVIKRGVNMNIPANELLSSIAKKNKIKVQYSATDGCGTNAGYVSSENGGIKAIDLGIPLRYMHTKVEVINLKDLSEGSKLLKHLVLSPKLRGVIEK